MFRFIHCADTHIDSPLRGLEQYEGAPSDRIRGATRRALENLVEFALHEETSFILIAGDLYDGDWKDYNTGLFLARQASRLQEAGVKVFIISGNHDAASQITRSLRMPGNVTFLSTKAPETILLEEWNVAIHGQGFAQRVVTKDLAASFPVAVPGCFNIGMLHTSLTGREGHETYAPCSLETLLVKGYDYWALGHVHKREVVHENPWVLFSGNTQGRHIRETGRKGCTVVEVDMGVCKSVEYRDLHVLRWALIDVDATGAGHPADLVDKARSLVLGEFREGSDEFLAVRLRLTGACNAHKELAMASDKWINEIRAALYDATGGAAWLEKVELKTRSEMDLDLMLGRDDPLGDFLRYIHALESGDLFIESVREDFAQLRAKLPPDAAHDDFFKALETKEGMRGVIEEVKQILVPRILSAGAGQ
jgi:exonuclease SbcD